MISTDAFCDGCVLCLDWGHYFVVSLRICAQYGCQVKPLLTWEEFSRLTENNDYSVRSG